MGRATTIAILLGLCSGCGRIGFDAIDIDVTDGDASTGALSFRKAIAIDGSKVAGPLTDFPVLIRLTSDADLAAAAQDDGDDIRFTSDAGSQLAHQIETFDAATGELVAWVKVPTLTSGSDTVLYLHFGDPAASNQQNPSAVWDADFMGVWHLQEASPAIDSTTHQNHGTPSGAVAFGVTGQIADAASFDGASGYLDAGADVSTELVASGALTISGWFTATKAPTTGGWQTPVFSHASSGDTYQLRYGSDEAVIGMYALSVHNGTQYRRRTSSLMPGVAHHIVATWDGSVARTYANGVEDSSDVTTSISAGTVTNLRLGTKNDGAPMGSVSFGGSIDEVRISRVARAPEWVSTEHANQSSPSTFYSLGPAEAL